MIFWAHFKVWKNLLGALPLHIIAPNIIRRPSCSHSKLPNPLFHWAKSKKWGYSIGMQNSLLTLHSKWYYPFPFLGPIFQMKKDQHCEKRPISHQFSSIIARVEKDIWKKGKWATKDGGCWKQSSASHLFRIKFSLQNAAFSSWLKAFYFFPLKLLILLGNYCTKHWQVRRFYYKKALVKAEMIKVIPYINLEREKWSGNAFTSLNNGPLTINDIKRQEGIPKKARWNKAIVAVFSVEVYLGILNKLLHDEKICMCWAQN